MREWWPILPKTGNSDYAPSFWIRAEVPLVFLAYAIGDDGQCLRTFGPFLVDIYETARPRALDAQRREHDDEAAPVTCNFLSKLIADGTASDVSTTLTRPLRNGWNLHTDRCRLAERDMQAHEM